MGQTLSEPVTIKNSSACENAKFKVGSSSMQGWRVSMEDAHTHMLELPDDSNAAFFAVFDGHGGATVSRHVAGNLHRVVVQRPEYKNGDIPAALTKGFLEMDQTMQNDDKFKNEASGTTAVTCLIKGNKLYCANAGDSRAVACINGKCHPLSVDHKPNNPAEEARIKSAGGWIEMNRVNGNLALSRALGDFAFKRNSEKTPEEQMVSALPDVEERTITEDWEFILLCCDGIWDVITNEEACELVRYPLGNGMQPEKVCEELLKTCLAPDCQMGGLGCDNMTAVLVCLLHGKSWSSYCSNIAKNIDINLSGYAHRSHDLSTADSSSSDDETVVPAEKSEAAKSIDAALCLSLRKLSTSESIHAGDQVVDDSKKLQKVMQGQDFIHNSKGEVVPPPGGDQPSSPTTEVELLGALDSEILPAKPEKKISFDEDAKSEYITSSRKSKKSSK